MNTQNADARIEMLKEVRALSAKAQSEGRDFTDAERALVTDRFEKIKAATEQKQRVEKSARQVAEIESWLNADAGPVDQDVLRSGTGGGRNMKAALANFAHTAAAAMTGRKAEVNPQGSFTAATPFVSGTQDAAIGPDPANGLLGLVSFDEKTFTEGHQFSYLREKTRIGRAAVVPDRAQKPTSDYELEERTDHLKVLAHLAAPIPTRYLEDYKSLARYLETVMGRDLYRLMSEEIINGDGTETHLQGILTLSGVQQTAYAGSLPATLRKARTTLANVDEKPTAWLVNPTDAEAFDLFADAQQRFQSLRDILGNLAVVPSTAVPVGQAILADWSQAVVVLRANDGVRLSAHDGLPYRDPVTGATDGTNLFERNLVQIRAELRAGGLAVTRPKAFTVVDLTAA